MAELLNNSKGPRLPSEVQEHFIGVLKMELKQ